MKATIAFTGARVIDSLPFSQSGTSNQAQALKDRGVDGVCGYLGVINPERLNYIISAGLAFMPVTLAGAYFDGASAEITQLKALGLPQATTVWLDLEGMKSFTRPAAEQEQQINQWGTDIKSAGFIPGLYIGSPQPFTGDELARLNVFRYWKAPSRVLDRNGKSWDEPTGCGFCMWQMWPQGMYKDTGVFVDVNIIGQDRKGRLPTWAVG